MNMDAEYSILLLKDGAIGRGEDVEYKIDDKCLSQRHCEIKIEDGKIRIKDLGSKNGTKVNGVFVYEAILQEGDILQLGSTIYVLNKKDGQYILEKYIGRNIDEKNIKGIWGMRFGKAEDSTLNSIKNYINSSDEIRLSELMRTLLNQLKIILSCQDIFLIEIRNNSSIIREAITGENFKLSRAVIRYFEEKFRLRNESNIMEEGSSLISEGVWAPRDIKTETLAGVFENAVYCVPIFRSTKSETLLYIRWKYSYLEPSKAIEIIRDKIDLLGMIANRLWEEMDIGNNILNEIRQLKVPLIGNSVAFKELLKQVYKAAMTDFPVALVGARGVGKSRIAEAIHYLSRRHNKPYERFNCANYPSDKIEPELFGIVRGTYADTITRDGILLQANKGTFFIDSLEACPVEVQKKLNDVLEGYKIRKLGDAKEIGLDIRFIGALNEDPIKLIKEGRLKEDFWDRIATIIIKLPLLSERISDIPELAFYFLEQSKLENKGHFKPRGFSPEAIKALQSYHWPGNVRELKNVIRRLLTNVEREIITDNDVKIAIAQEKNNHMLDLAEIFNLPYEEAKQIFEERYIAKKLEQTGGKVSKAAELSKLTRAAIYTKLRKNKYNINFDEES